VTRDRIMREMDLTYPEYGFSTHKGYITKIHTEALQKFGVAPIHRRSFSNIAGLL
jgi:ribonuclease HII